MPVVGVHETAAARPPKERPWREEAIEDSGQPADGASFRRVRMHDLGTSANHETPHMPDGSEITRGQLSAHGGDDQGRYSVVGGERAHVLFSRRNDPGGEHRLERTSLKGCSEPGDVSRR